MAKKRTTSPNPGLTPPDLRDRIKKELGLSDVAKVSKVRKADDRANKPTVSKPRKRTLADTSGGGVFGAVDVQDSVGDTDSKQAKISDDRGTTDELIGLRDLLETEIRKINPDEGVSYLRCIVQQALKKAAKGEQWAMSFIRDIVDGRPGQAATRSVRMEDVEKQLEDAEVNLLNTLGSPD